MADQTGLKLRCSCPQEDHAQCCFQAIARRGHQHEHSVQQPAGLDRILISPQRLKTTRVVTVVVLMVASAPVIQTQSLRRPRVCGSMKSRPLQLRRCRTSRFGSLGFAVFRFALSVPAAKIERDSHAGGAQFVRQSAVDHGTSHDHASDG